MNHADTTLANLLREELTAAIAREIQGLIKVPTDRRAGRIEALQDVMGMVDGTYSKLNDARSKQQET